MAWTETCKIDFKKQIDHKREQGISIRAALKQLSDESEISINTLNSWLYPREYKKKESVVENYHTSDNVFTKLSETEISNIKPEQKREIVRLAKEITQKDNVLATKYTGDAESYTPSKYIEKARLVMGSIDIDPASNEIAQETVKAKTWYSKEDDGLTKSWEGNIFLNPPYNHGVIDKFVKKLLEELDDTKQAVLLTNNNTDTRWFHSAAKNCALLCFTKGRINFYKADESKTDPLNGQTFFYFGNNADRFKEVFSEIGGIAIWL